MVGEAKNSLWTWNAIAEKGTWGALRTDELENSPCGKVIPPINAGLPLENEYAEIFPASVQALGLFSLLHILFFSYADPQELLLPEINK